MYILIPVLYHRFSICFLFVFEGFYLPAMGPSILAHKPYSKHISWTVKGTTGKEVHLSAFFRVPAEQRHALSLRKEQKYETGKRNLRSLFQI